MKPVTRPYLLTLVGLAFTATTAALAGEHLASEHVHIMDPWSRELPAVSTNGAAYFTAMNKGKRDGRIVGASSPLAKRVEFHIHKMEGDLMKMRKVEGGVPVPSGESVTFEPGGLHVMLIDLSQPLQAGMTFPLTLEFKDGGSIDVEVNVLSMDEAANKGGAMGHGGHGDMKSTDDGKETRSGNGSGSSGG